MPAIPAVPSFMVIAIAILIFVVLLGIIITRLWRRATREVSLVRTGSGGRRIVMDGGCIVVPAFHEITKVNMKTLRLEVKRTNEGALITKDRMRVDVGVEFYVRVNATEEGVARAAQTLGDKTFNVEQLKDMIEGKLVDGLRAVAARMSMDELHENRSDFVQEVQNAVNEDLTKNGLELESVSLTALDQTPFEALDENNAFNAVGMRRLAEVISTSKKERAQIDAEADVAVRLAAMEAERRKLQIEQDEEQARVAQQQEIETYRAAQRAEIARRQAESDQASEEARIQMEREVRAAEIARERTIRESEITKDKELQAAEIASTREIEVANQEKQIIVNQKSEEESRARASADEARAEAVKASEAIATAREVAEAERLKQVALIEAAKEAERAATRIRVEAKADREAASDRAEARREEAQAEADALTIRAEAKKKDMLAEAEGRRAIVEADNALSEQIVQMKVDMARLEAMPGIVAEMVRPAEKIDSIRIHQVQGLGGAGANGSGEAPQGGAVNQALDSILGMALQLPAMKSLGAELSATLGAGFDEATGDVPATRSGDGAHRPSLTADRPAGSE